MDAGRLQVDFGVCEFAAYVARTRGQRRLYLGRRVSLYSESESDSD